jgi:glycosyltransferase involved in cell wall biosynthesis
MQSFKRILVLNNYSVARVKKEINYGNKPSHHLYGISQLEKLGYNLIIIDPTENIWRKIGKFLGRIPFLNLGDLDQQISALRRVNEYDIIYAPCQNVTNLLGILSYFKLLDKKIIAIAHHPTLVGRIATIRKISMYFTIKGHYKWGALSNTVANEINSIAHSKIAVSLAWGPDLSYYDHVLEQLEHGNNKDVDLISIGRTGRDYDVLVRAFNNTNISVEIYCSRESSLYLLDKCTKNIKIINLDNEEALTYPQVIKLCTRAKILAVPLNATTSLAGLTSVADAMALGMPLLITYNKYIEFDIEGEGMGHWLQLGNDQEWLEKATYLLNDPEGLLRISKKTRKIAEERFNIINFTDQLIKLLEL